MKTKKITFGKILQYLILLIGATVAILPILVVFIGSFKSNTEFLSTGVLELPKSLDFSNYKMAFVNGQMLLGFKNTLIIFVVSMLGKLTLASMFAYAVSRFDFKLKKLILTLFMLAMLIPSITRLNPTTTIPYAYKWVSIPSSLIGNFIQDSCSNLLKLSWL